jgi:hypothetical protein
MIMVFSCNLLMYALFTCFCCPIWVILAPKNCRLNNSVILFGTYYQFNTLGNLFCRRDAYTPRTISQLELFLKIYASPRQMNNYYSINFEFCVQDHLHFIGLHLSFILHPIHYDTQPPHIPSAEWNKNVDHEFIMGQKYLALPL